MSARADRASELRGLVRLAATEPLGADPDRVAAMLASDPPWASLVAHPSEVPGLRRYALDLRLRLGGEGARFTTFSKAALLDIGTPARTASGWAVECGWRASSAAPLFPVFSGKLLIEPGELAIDGLYAPPGGVIGRVADRMLLQVAANGTARWLLGEIDRAGRALERPPMPEDA
ncbi:MAG: hypothetical protein IT341_03325 [Chloroflexi bacterium]|nr:hypothetical protein [Chloroflexota bacterium]